VRSHRYCKPEHALVMKGTQFDTLAIPKRSWRFATGDLCFARRPNVRIGYRDRLLRNEPSGRFGHTRDGRQSSASG
jgi:hypothetical protein